MGWTIVVWLGAALPRHLPHCCKQHLRYVDWSSCICWETRLAGRVVKIQLGSTVFRIAGQSFIQELKGSIEGLMGWWRKYRSWCWLASLIPFTAWWWMLSHVPGSLDLWEVAPLSRISAKNLLKVHGSNGGTIIETNKNYKTATTKL